MLASVRIKLAVAVVGLFTAVLVSGASAADFEHDEGPCHETPGEALLGRCPTGHVGEEYEIEIVSEEGSGCEPYDYFEIHNSVLPPGLSLTREGVISGVPTSTGFWRFWLWDRDLTAKEGGPSWCQFEDKSEREFSIQIDPGLAIVNESLGPASVSQAYSETLTAKQVTNLNPLTGSDVQATWSLASGVLPPGLALSPQGVVTGTPTAEGTWGFAVRAQNGSTLDSKEYALTVRQPLVVTSPFAPGLRSSAEVGVRFGKTVTATGGSGTYTWSVSSGALPSGLVLDPAKGTIAGAPTAAGRFTFGLTATDSEGRATSVNSALNVAARLAVTTSRLNAATVGGAYRAALRTTGGVKPLKWRVASGKLPAGVRLSPTLGTLAGRPTKAGTYRITVEARDALGAKSQKALVLTVRG